MEVIPAIPAPSYPRVPETLSITAANGVRFLVRIIRTGDKYGLNDVLTVGEGTSLRIEGEGPFVEFYDTRFMHTPRGQFVSRYGVSTLMGWNRYGTGRGGLDLQTDVDSWKIDSASMDIVRAWLDHEVP